MKLVAIAHKREKGKPVVELEAAEVSCQTGVADDISGGPGTRQVTVLSADVWREVCAELGQSISWTIRRANLLLEGVVFAATDVGRILAIGDTQLEVTKETPPCKLMDDQVPGLRTALTKEWRGGVCCRVLQGGTIAIGDVVTWGER